MYGFNSEAEARDAYLSNYEKGWQGLGKITGVSKDTFDKWLDSSTHKTKDFADYAIVKKEPMEKVTEGSETDIALRDALVNEAREAGVEVSMDAEEGQARLDQYNERVRKAKAKKRAVETASLIQKEGSPADISTVDGAKIAKKIDSLVNKLEKVTNIRKNCIDEAGEALEAKQDGSKSWYKTFITQDGTFVTIRLGNHNATVSAFDYKGEDFGISIVVSKRENEGINNKSKDSGKYLLEESEKSGNAYEVQKIEVLNDERRALRMVWIAPNPKV